MGFGNNTERAALFKYSIQLFKHYFNFRYMVYYISHIYKIEKVVHKWYFFMVAFFENDIRIFVNGFLSHLVSRFYTIHISICYPLQSTGEVASSTTKIKYVRSFRKRQIFQKSVYCVYVLFSC